MNMSPHRLRQQLGELAPLAPPPGLDERIGKAYRRRLRRRRKGAIALALVLACLAAVPFAPHLPPPVEPGTVAAGGQAPDRDTLASVRALDRALQTAYGRNAGDDEIAPLWAERARLLGHEPTPAGI